jgi:hypothetical protein
MVGKLYAESENRTRDTRFFRTGHLVFGVVRAYAGTFRKRRWDGLQGEVLRSHPFGVIRAFSTRRGSIWGSSGAKRAFARIA